MQCPQCADSPLVHAMLTDHLPAYSCGKCLGTLVSLVAYRAWRETLGRGGIPAAPAAEPEADAPDSIAAKKCPRCRSLMSKYRITAEKANRLDYCPHCEDIWLDDGEWHLVESLAASGEFAKIFTQSWQRAVRDQIADSMREHRLRDLLGPDYQRTMDFRAWLGQHSARNEILAFIASK